MATPKKATEKAPDASKPFTPAEALAAATERARQWATPTKQEAAAKAAGE